MSQLCSFTGMCTCSGVMFPAHLLLTTSICFCNNSAAPHLFATLFTLSANRMVHGNQNILEYPKLQAVNIQHNKYKLTQHSYQLSRPKTSTAKKDYLMPDDLHQSKKTRKDLLLLPVVIIRAAFFMVNMGQSGTFQQYFQNVDGQRHWLFICGHTHHKHTVFRDNKDMAMVGP